MGKKLKKKLKNAKRQSLWSTIAKASSAALGVMAGYILRDPQGLSRNDWIAIVLTAIVSFSVVWYAEYKRLM